jgi:hypothetical protein
MMHGEKAKLGCPVLNHAAWWCLAQRRNYQTPSVESVTPLLDDAQLYTLFTMDLNLLFIMQ